MMRSWLIGLTCLAGAALGAERAPNAGSSAVTLPPVSVEASRNGDFYLLLDGMPAQRIQFVADKGPSDHPAHFKYCGKGLRAGDEIVSVDGKAFAAIPPGEWVGAFRRAFKKSSKDEWIAQIEVRAAGAKEIRKITLIEVARGLEVIPPPK
jgi:hypothetical protein